MGPGTQRVLVLSERRERNATDVGGDREERQVAGQTQDGVAVVGSGIPGARPRGELYSLSITW